MPNIIIIIILLLFSVLPVLSVLTVEKVYVKHDLRFSRRCKSTRRYDPADNHLRTLEYIKLGCHVTRPNDTAQLVELLTFKACLPEAGRNLSRVLFRVLAHFPRPNGFCIALFLYCTTNFSSFWHTSDLQV